MNLFNIFLYGVIVFCVLKPLAALKRPNNYKGTSIYKLILIRDSITLFIVLSLLAGLSSNNLVLVTTIEMFICIIGMLMLQYKRADQRIKNLSINQNKISNNIEQKLVLKCAKCGNLVKANYKFCDKCGSAIEKNSASSENNILNPIEDKSPIVSFDSKYYPNEEIILQNIIKEELNKRGENINNFVTKKLNIKRNILLTFLGIITFLITLLYFFNYPLNVCLLCEAIIVILYVIISRSFNSLKIFTNKIKKHPDTDINVLIGDILNEKQECVLSKYLKFILVLFFAIFIPTINFIKPKEIYTRYDDGYQLVKYTRGIISEEEVTVLDTYKGKRVLAIGESAFANAKIKKINLPDTLVAIKTKAFSNCKYIEVLNIPSNVTEIRASAFEDMSSLFSVTLPEGLLEIRASAFANNTNLKNITLPSTLKYLGASAFENCTSLKSIVIPSGVTELNGATFKNCTSLAEVKLHDNIISIHGENFQNCSSLKRITLPKNITEIRGNTFENCSSLVSIDIPSGVTRIGGHAFHGCTSLTQVDVPKTVTEIGSSAFRDCYKLTEIYLPRNAYVNERAFKNSPTKIIYR